MSYNYIGKTGFKPTDLNKIDRTVTVHPRVKEALANPSNNFLLRNTHVSAVNAVKQPKYYGKTGIIVENIGINQKGDAKLIVRQFEKGKDGFFKSKPVSVNIPKGTAFTKIQHTLSDFAKGCTGKTKLSELFTKIAKLKI